MESLIRLPEVRKKLGNVGRSTIYYWLSRPEELQFPKQIKIGKSSFWSERELENWLQSRPRGTYGEGGKS